jgi:hypothetical protein
MLQTHPHSHDKGTTAPLSLQEAENIWHGPSDPQKFYSCTIESILTGKCSALDCKALHRVVQTAQYTLGSSSLPSRTSISGGVEKAGKCIDFSHLID